MKHLINLTFSFAKRDFKERYIGTGLGQFWYILSPLIMIFIYTVVFSDFMKMKLDIVDNTYAYSIYLVPGLLAWTTFSTIISRLSTSFFEKANLIKKISVPMFVFQGSIMITESFLLLISFSLALGFLFLVNHPITLSFLCLLPIMFFQMIFAFSLGVIISLFVPFFKDLKVAVPIILQLSFWMTPIIYMKEMILDKYPFIIKYNPFYYYISLYQDIFLYSKVPSFKHFALIIFIAFFTLGIAAFLYKKMISTIKDII
ncbi:ABC transporter permease [Campylobacterota bacterium DY0563]